jgi:Na+-transporting NADH:ubiquinone oxidoreductase subunit B
MLKKLIDFQYRITEQGKPLEKLRSLASAFDHFCYKSDEQATKAPFFRDAVDLKRWMFLVIYALLPCLLMSIWNTGVQNLVYTSSDLRLMQTFLQKSGSIGGYFDFCIHHLGASNILIEGLSIILPIVLTSYVVGGAWEILFACIRGHDINEGFLVTGILFPLTLPSTIPLWMVAMGISFGTVVGKELFGGTGMNILNPALTARAFLFFSFPARITGNIWSGKYPMETQKSLIVMNNTNPLEGIDAITEATAVQALNIPDDVKRIHVDAILAHLKGIKSVAFEKIEYYFKSWSIFSGNKSAFDHLTFDQFTSFLTDPLKQGGLGLHSDYVVDAFQFVKLKLGMDQFSVGNLFFGNVLGSLGETSKLAILIGALLLIYTGVGSWRIMLSVIVGAVLTSGLFKIGSHFGKDFGLWNPAKFDFPVYKELLIGSLLFGAVFFATDPVSAPDLDNAKLLYGLCLGGLIVVIRMVNAAFPEGVALAIIFMNVFSPIFDFYNVKHLRRKKLNYG